MTGLNHETWERLSGYVDGELGAPEIARLEARLRTDPALEPELKRLRDLKQELALLRPSETTPGWFGLFHEMSRTKHLVVGLGVVLVVAVLALVTLTVGPSEHSSWLARALALHNRLSRSTYVVDAGYAEKIVSTRSELAFRAPDLTASKLYLVDVVTAPDDDGEAIALHYRGSRGCRLTVVAVEGPPDPIAMPVEDMLTRTWSYDGFDFAVIAKGMDSVRFASVAAYVEAALSDDMRRLNDLRTAMLASYSTGQTCA
jgi:anti-sigma factor RsiW